MGTTAEIAQGRLSGFEDAGLQVFLGIPFAKPPTGLLRFRPPRPAEPWSSVRDATRHGCSAPQAAMKLEKVMPGFDVGEQSEDCLYLNVFTPAADAARRPVMVWIHGGAYTLGSASQKMYDVRGLARQGDLVCVTINYRLGALAFTHLAGVDPALDTSACAGIQDQVQALRWVRENIAAFGGNPEQVTIFGESAGGFSVGTLLGMPEAKGLFERAMPQSGAAHLTNDAETGTRVARRLLEELGVAPGEVAKLWELPWQAILKAQQEVERRELEGTHSRPFKPVVDGRALSQRPIDAIAGGLSADVPVVVGACRDEEKLFTLWDPTVGELDEPGLVKRVDALVPGHGHALVDAYRQARAARGADTSAFELWCAIETDRVFRVPAVRLAEAQSRHQPATWSYLVTWESQAMGGKLGACHGIDLPFVFGQVGSKTGGIFAGSGPEAQRLSREMMGAWIAFARAGDPNHAELVSWPGHDETRRATMLFGRKSEVVEAPLEGERRAWEGIL
jgi:para-nitrobenzyl esterase